MPTATPHACATPTESRPGDPATDPSRDTARPGSVVGVHPKQARNRTDNPPHRTTVVERGAFAAAKCQCGWHGPARRARDRARQDAAGHPGTH